MADPQDDKKKKDQGDKNNPPAPTPKVTTPATPAAPAAAPTSTPSPTKSGPPVQAVITDPKFQALPFQERIKVLQSVDPKFAALSIADQQKVIRELNPEYLKQKGLSAFALGTSQEGREPIEPTKWGVTKWVMKETGAGVWDAAKGVGNFFDQAIRAINSDQPPEEQEKAMKRVYDMTIGNVVTQLGKYEEAHDVLLDALYGEGGSFGHPGKKNPYLAAAIAEQTPRAIGQYEGAELGAKVVGKVTGAPEAALTLKEKGIQSGMQEHFAGVGPSAAEDLVAKTRERLAKQQAKYESDLQEAKVAREKAEADYKAATEADAKKHAQTELEKKQQHEKVLQRQARIHQKHVDRVEAENAQKLKDHAEEVKRIDELNKAEEEKVGKRAELATKIKSDSATLGQQLKDFYNKAKAKGKQLYKPVDAATDGMTVPSADVAAFVTHAEDNILRGSTENIKQFTDILHRSEEDTSLEESAEDERGYVSKIEAGEPLTFRDLQGYYEELGKKIYGPGSSEMMSDVRNALRYVREQIGKQKMAMASRAGVGDALRAADKFHSQLQATFNDMSPVQRARNIGQRAGSPVARAVRAVDPQYIRDPFLNPAYGERALDLLKAYTEKAPEAPKAPAPAAPPVSKTGAGGPLTPTGRPVPQEVLDMQAQPGSTERISPTLKDWEPPPELGYSAAEDLGKRQGKEPGRGEEATKEAGERRKVDRSAQAEEDKLFARARTELGEGASSDEVAAKVEELRPPGSKPPERIPLKPGKPTGKAAGKATATTLAQDASALVKTVETIQKDYAEFSSLPKKAKVTEHPAPPTLKAKPEPPEPAVSPAAKTFEAKPFEVPAKAEPPVPPSGPPPITELAKELKEIRKAGVAKKVKELSTFNRWDYASGIYGALQLARLEWPEAWAYTLGHYGVTRLVKLPWAQRMLTEITPADIDILRKVYENNPGGKAEAQAAMTEMLTKSGRKVKPGVLMNLAKFLTKPQIQQIIRTGAKAGIVNQVEKSRQAQEKEAAGSADFMKDLDQLDQELQQGPQ